MPGTILASEGGRTQSPGAQVEGSGQPPCEHRSKQPAVEEECDRPAGSRQEKHA